MLSHKKDNQRPAIPHAVWSADWLRQAEKEAAASLGLTLYELMQRAGQAAFNLACCRYPHARHWLILCGHGNNGGDGYVVARLAAAAGIAVTLLAFNSDKPLPSEARQARQAWLDAGGTIHASDITWPENITLIVDGLLGTGLNNAPRESIRSLIVLANQHPAPILALDVPSGLAAQTGTIPGEAIDADCTITFIALRTGLLTGKARDVVGKLYYDALGLEPWLTGQNAPIRRRDATELARWLHPRAQTSHKGDNGRLLLIGGDNGTAGAIRLAGEAALRCGAGLVRVLTREENIQPLITARPELMVDALSAQTISNAIKWADVIVIGPGLGTQTWGRQALEAVAESEVPMLWDADALNLLALNPGKRHNRIITPHPGEAARLLGCSVAEIEQDRLLSAQRLVKRYGGCVVLKGAGTIVASSNGRIDIIDAGNPGMGSGGMGDVLSGIIGALLAQKLGRDDAACAGCIIHGAAADWLAERYGTRGMLATDLFTALYRFINPELNS